MQLALLTGAIPRTCARGPKVRLQRGSWRLDCQGLIDSKLFLIVHLPDQEDDAYTLNVVGDTEIALLNSSIVQICFDERGNEKHISIFANKVA